MAIIEIDYCPRAQFVDFHERTQRWAIAVCHRRAGKTVACINDLIRRAIECRRPDARFAYVAPTYGQAKDVAWDYLKRFAAPLGIVQSESELRIDLPNRSRIRLYGADNYDRMRGLYLDGCVLDEYGDMDPRAWSEVIRPALSDRLGWAVFIGTPKGRNHYAKMWDEATLASDWYKMRLRASESGILPAEELASARSMMTPEQYAAEYECSFQAAVIGAYYGKDMEAAEADGRICDVPYDKAVVVHTAWDLGIGDATAIWFFQIVGPRVHVIDYIESSGVGLDWYCRQLDERPYKYGDHILPHDAEVRELGTGKTRLETLRSLGMGSTKIIPAQSVEDGINAGRLMIGRSYFDAKRCARGIEALRNYRAEWDNKRDALRSRPLHDWSSHAADAWRYAALGEPSSSWEAFTKPMASMWPKTKKADKRVFV